GQGQDAEGLRALHGGGMLLPRPPRDLEHPGDPKGGGVVGVDAVFSPRPGHGVVREREEGEAAAGEEQGLMSPCKKRQRPLAGSLTPGFLFSTHSANKATHRSVVGTGVPPFSRAVHASKRERGENLSQSIEVTEATATGAQSQAQAQAQAQATALARGSQAPQTLLFSPSKEANTKQGVNNRAGPAPPPSPSPVLGNLFPKVVASPVVHGMHSGSGDSMGGGSGLQSVPSVPSTL
ncbi:unnamed protein product, partial [Discosporangium mesarthrocarpum]